MILRRASGRSPSGRFFASAATSLVALVSACSGADDAADNPGGSGGMGAGGSSFAGAPAAGTGTLPAATSGVPNGASGAAVSGAPNGLAGSAGASAGAPGQVNVGGSSVGTGGQGVSGVAASGAAGSSSEGGGGAPRGGASGAAGVASGAAGKAGAPGSAGMSAAGASGGPTGNTSVQGLIGFAAAEGHGLRTTTGAGNGAPVVRVTSFAEFVAAVGDSTPRIVEVAGRITGSGVDMVDIGSNKTILGVGSTATIDGFGLDINGWTPKEVAQFGTDVCAPANIAQFPRVQNVIVRNLTFTNTPDDSINVQCYSHHVWVDHNTFNVSVDGSVDVKRGSDLVTVSWNRFVNTDKTMLLGHSADNGEQDRGFLRVTYHHNWFDNTATRTPRVRFGYAHVFNNFLDSTDYFLGLGAEASIYAEGNYVQKAKTLTQTFTESTGYHLTWAASNRYDQATITRANDSASVPKDWLDADGTVKPPAAYTYTLDSAASLPAAVQSGAGAGKL